MRADVGVTGDARRASRRIGTREDLALDAGDLRFEVRRRAGDARKFFVASDSRPRTATRRAGLSRTGRGMTSLLGTLLLATPPAHSKRRTSETKSWKTPIFPHEIRLIYVRSKAPRRAHDFRRVVSAFAERKSSTKSEVRDAGRVGSVDPVLREVVAERALADAHQLGGVLLHAVATLERAPDGLALGPVEVLPQIQRRQSRRAGARRAPASAATAALIDRRRREHDRALDRVLELAHVARPVGRLQRASTPASMPSIALAGALRVLRDEVLDEHRNVLAPLAQRRNRRSGSR